MRVACSLLLFVLLAAGSALAQDWRQGEKEIGFFAGGGPSIPGGVTGRSFVVAGARFGYQLTGVHSWGSLQWAAEAIPVYLMFQSNTTYGVAFTPFLFRWHGGHGRLVPIVEFGAGMLGTRDPVPEGVSRFNFTPQGGIALQYRPGGRAAWTFGLRYHHTSDAGITAHNPGINALMLHLGVSWFR